MNQFESAETQTSNREQVRAQHRRRRQTINHWLEEIIKERNSEDVMVVGTGSQRHGGKGNEPELKTADRKRQQGLSIKTHDTEKHNYQNKTGNTKWPTFNMRGGKKDLNHDVSIIFSNQDPE